MTAMLDHPIIDVTLGLVFFYVVLSLVASAVQEWIRPSNHRCDSWAGVLLRRIEFGRIGSPGVDCQRVRIAFKEPALRR